MAENNENELILLKNSNPLNKYPVDAEQLNHNFEVLAKNQGTNAIKQLIESSGQVYTPVIDNQLAMAVAQYVFSATLFDEKGSTNAFKLYPKDGFSAPYRYTYGMVVSFVPTRTNTGPMTLQIGTNTAYPVYIGVNSVPSGFIVPNTLMSFRFMGSYWEQVSSNSSGSTGGSATTPGTDSSLLGVIQGAITSAGIVYDPTKTEQLAQAISTYIVGMCYNSVYENNTYTLFAQNAQETPASYFEGMVVWFYPNSSNTAANPGIKIGNLLDTAILDYNGQIIPSNYISTGSMLAVRYINGAFRIISNYLPNVVFRDGVQITSVSNDPTLVNANQQALVTEYAVKKYVDSNIKSSTENTIIEGYTENGQPASLNVISKHQVQLKASSTGSSVLEFTPNDTADLIASSNQGKATNAIDKFNTTYWETQKTGYLLDDKKRQVAGDQGSKYIEIVYNSEGDVEYLHTPAEPEWIGFKNLTKLPDVLYIAMTDSNHTPAAIRAEVNTSPTLDQSLWMPLVTKDGESDNQYILDYGNFTLLTQDASGYYTVLLPNTVFNGSAIEPFSPSGAFALRFVVETSDNQFPTTEQINASGYDPNTDRTSEQYTWQIKDMSIGSLINDVPQFSFVYPSGTIEIIDSPIYYTQYLLNQEDTSVSTLDSLANGRYILYKTYGSEYLDSVLKSKVSYQSELPTPSAATLGNLCIVISTRPYKTYICTQQDTDYVWTETEFMLLGGFDVANNCITSVINYAYGTLMVKDFSFTKDFDTTIQHNFGSDVSVSCLLVCNAANNGYDVGDQVAVYPEKINNYTLSGNTTDGYTLNNSISVFNIVNTNITTKIKAKNYVIANKDTGTFVAVAADNWTLRVYISKE